MDRLRLIFYDFATNDLVRKPFQMVAGVRMPGISGRGVILSDFRELSLCGPCEPFFVYYNLFNLFSKM